MFEESYEAMERDRFANAFTYGRYKVDVVLDRELNRLAKGSRVLDVGCGTGAYLQRFAKMGFAPAGSAPDLRAVTAPTLVLHGDADPVVPVTHAEFYASAIAGARLKVLPGAGHAFLLTFRAASLDHLRAALRP